MLKAAHELHDLKVPPGNRLEPLKGDLKGHWSIRVNQQWRIVFKWDDETRRRPMSTSTTTTNNYYSTPARFWTRNSSSRSVSAVTAWPRASA